MQDNSNQADSEEIAGSKDTDPENVIRGETFPKHKRNVENRGESSLSVLLKYILENRGKESRSADQPDEIDRFLLGIGTTLKK